MSKNAYMVDGSTTLGSGAKTMANVIAGATVRPAITEFGFSIDSTPADNCYLVTLERHTAVGTAGSSPTPSPLDPASAAAIFTAGAGHSAEPTYTASVYLFRQTIHHRIPYRWAAIPNYELVAPATANNGIGGRSLHASATPVARIQFYVVQ